MAELKDLVFAELAIKCIWSRKSVQRCKSKYVYGERSAAEAEAGGGSGCYRAARTL